jgi:hypothetical protein
MVPSSRVFLAATVVALWTIVPATRRWSAIDLQAQTTMAGGWFLTFPLPNRGPYDPESSTVGINSVMDHEVSTGWYNRDLSIVAFTGETARSQYGVHPSHNDLYRQQSLGDFLLAGTYTGGSWGKRYLSYDGHPGIDFRAASGTDILAPADGTLFIPTTDAINGTPSTFNTFVIDHGNGYATWFLHAQRGSIVAPGPVFRGNRVARVGDTGVAGSPHLHFEVRRGANTPVDPYGWDGGCSDPYTASLATKINTNLWTNSGTSWHFSIINNEEGWFPANVECASVHSDAFHIDPTSSDPYLQSPPLMNVSASAVKVIELRIASRAPDGNGSIYFTTAASPAWGEDKRMPFTVFNDGLWHAYRVLTTHSLWSGLITGIRVDPAGTGRSGTSSDTIAFDYIRLASASGDSADPVISSFAVTPDSTSLGNAFVMQATVSDAGGSGLDRVELWRAPDVGGSPGTWSEMTRQPLSGDGPVTVTLSNAPTSAGAYWYGIHVFDGANNQTNEPGGPVRRTVTGAAPGAFGKSAPADGAAGVATNQALSWGASSGAAGYQYCIDSTNNNSCDGLWTSTGIATTATPSLSTGTTYYWQVRAVAGAATTDANNGSWWSFTTDTPWPGSFGKILPANGASGVAINASLSWGTSAAATSYQYCFDTTHNGTCNATWISTGSSTSVTVSLAADTTYSWQVRAVNTTGTTGANAGSWFSFSTGAAPSIATEPQSETVAFGQSATLSVMVSGTGPFTYQWYQGSSGATGSPIAGQTAATFTTPGLISNTRYWVRVSGSSGTVDSSTATVTVLFTDPSLTAQQSVLRAVHMSELRLRIDALRVRYGYQAYQWTDDPLVGVVVKALHLTEIRAALADAYGAAGVSPPSYTDPVPLSGATPIRAIHILELRAAIERLE